MSAAALENRAKGFIGYIMNDPAEYEREKYA